MDNMPEAVESSGSPPNLAPVAPMAPTSRENRPTIVGPASGPEAPYPVQLKGVVTRGFGRGARFLGIPTANLPDTSLSPLSSLPTSTGIYYGFARVHPSLSTPLPTAPPTPSVSGTSTPLLHLPAHATHGKYALSKLHAHAHSHAHAALSPEEIQRLPAETAPYPPDSAPLAEEDEPAPKRLSEEDTQVWPMVMSVGWNPYFKNEKVTAEVHIMHPFAHDFYGHDMSVLVLGYIRPELDYVSKEALVADIQTDVKVALNSLAREPYAAYAGDAFFVKP